MARTSANEAKNSAVLKPQTFLRNSWNYSETKVKASLLSQQPVSDCYNTIRTCVKINNITLFKESLTFLFLILYPWFAEFHDYCLDFFLVWFMYMYYVLWISLFWLNFFYCCLMSLGVIFNSMLQTKKKNKKKLSI